MRSHDWGKNGLWSTLLTGLGRTISWKVLRVHAIALKMPVTGSKRVIACLHKSRTSAVVLRFCVSTTRKQDLAIRQVNDRYADAFLVGPRPCVARSTCIENQIPLRKWRLAFTWEKLIFKQRRAPYVCQLAAINICRLVEPTVQPVTSLVQCKWNVVWFEMKRGGRNTGRSSRRKPCPPENDNEECDYHSEGGAHELHYAHLGG